MTGDQLFELIDKGVGLKVFNLDTRKLDPDIAERVHLEMTHVATLAEIMDGALTRLNTAIAAAELQVDLERELGPLDPNAEHRTIGIGEMF